MGRKCENLVGRKYGKLTVTEELGHGRIMCRCDCGKVVNVRKQDVKSGNTASCGCARSDTYVKTMGKSISQDSDSRKLILLTSLPGNHRTLDLSGLTFNRLTVVKLHKAYMRDCGKLAVIWECRCECGNMVNVDAAALRSGHTKSCGCYERTNPGRLVDLAGRRFGRLVVLHRILGLSRNHFAVWKCKCDCGNECEVASNCLVHGMTSSCGCLKESKREMFVVRYLNELDMRDGVDYERQKFYDNLKGVRGRRLTYDFLLYKDGKPCCLIECQGEQHYMPVDWYGGEEKFEQQVEHDKRKWEYAESIGIPLFEIFPKHKTYDDIKLRLDEIFHSVGLVKT